MLGRARLPSEGQVEGGKRGINNGNAVLLVGAARRRNPRRSLGRQLGFHTGRRGGGGPAGPHSGFPCERPSRPSRKRPGGERNDLDYSEQPLIPLWKVTRTASSGPWSIYEISGPRSLFVSSTSHCTSASNSALSFVSPWFSLFNLQSVKLPFVRFVFSAAIPTPIFDPGRVDSSRSRSPSQSVPFSKGVGSEIKHRMLDITAFRKRRCLLRLPIMCKSHSKQYAIPCS